MRDIKLMKKDMGRVDFTTKMAECMMEIGYKIEWRDSALCTMILEKLLTKGNGRMINLMEKGNCIMKNQNNYRLFSIIVVLMMLMNFGNSMKANS